MKIIIGILSFLMLVAASSAVYFWYHGQKVPLTTTTYTEAPKIKVVTKIKTIKVPGPTQIVTIEKQVIVDKLKLPDWIKNDADQQTIATAAIPAYKGTTNTVAVINTKTGESQIVAKQEPLPLFGFVNDREIGLRSGIDIKGASESAVYGKWDFARIGPVYIGVYGDANTKGDARIQLSAGFRF
jgi:hypothetical protein